MDPIIQWDGLRGQAIPVGIAPPLASFTLSFTGIGTIVGDYTAYVRFLDENGVPSNLSPISNEASGFSTSGIVQDATNTTPIAIGSIGHGLNTGARVLIEGVLGNDAANGVWDIVLNDANNFSLYNTDGTPSSGNDSYLGGGTWRAGSNTIVYSNVPIPTESRVTRRQILRNTQGQATTYYVDVDTNDISSTTFISVRPDEDLANQEAVPILNPDGSLNANRYTVPPNHKAALASHLGRIFAGVEKEYVQGSIRVNFGSTTVEGVGTEWTSSLANRYLYIVGATKSYQISSVDTVNQRLTLTSAYLDGSDFFAVYAIRPAPAERRLIYYSEAGLPEAWPAINAIAVPEDGDELTGLMVQSSFLYFLEHRHIWRFTFQNNPAVDGFTFLSAKRGCINQKCWVVVEEMAYMLDETGIHAFSGGQEAEPISQSIQDIFRDDNDVYGINWKASDFFHACLDPQAETIYWFVAMSGEYLPRHAIAYNYRQKRWWIEEYNRPIGSSCTGRFRKRYKVFMGTDAKKILAKNEGTTDGPKLDSGTIRGTPSDASLMSLSDSTSSFPTTGTIGHALTIVDGRGKGQIRRISSVTAGVIIPTQPWLIVPDTESIYQLGGINWRFKIGEYHFLMQDDDSQRRFTMHFGPTSEDGLMNIRVFFDEDSSPQTWLGNYTSEEHVGIQVISGDPDLRVDLTHQVGVIQQRMDFHREMYIEGPRHMSLDFNGVTNVDPVSIFEVHIDGVTKS